METSDVVLWVFVALGIVAIPIILYRVLVWARTGSKGAVFLAAMFSVFTPDPIFEKNYKIVQEAKRQQEENEDESGDPPGA